MNATLDDRPVTRSAAAATPAPVVFGVTHLDLAVRSVAQARRLYVERLGFVPRAEGQGWCDLDAGGSVLLRLLEVRQPEHRCALRVQAPDPDAVLRALVAAGCTPLYDAARTPDKELSGAVRDPDGHTLTVWRPLTEDEYEVEPELPTAMGWQPDAEALLKQLLRSVPALFRGLARRKVVKMVESLATAGRVSREEVIRGYILASPRVTRGRNRKPLIEAGIDVERYQADWDAP